jgi:hypothetical protein
MTTERHISKLNRMLLAELGQNPLYRWIHSESADFKRAMRSMNDDGTPVWDYRCPCGLNVSVHSAECVAGRLVIAEPRWEIRKTDPTMEDQWVLCSLQYPMSPREWLETFGTRLPYPKNGSWAPVETETRTVAMPPGTVPGEIFNMALIRARQRSREIKASDIANAFESREQKKDQKRQENIRERISDALPVSPDPGKRNGNVSLPAVMFRPKHQSGENLVTL